MDAIGSALSAASNILGGPKGGGPAAIKDETLIWVKGDQLAVPEPNQGGAHAPEDLRVHDGGAAIEFLHFGYVYPDISTNFGHGTKTDDALLDLEKGAKSHAFMFRAALEREAILVSGFMTGCQRVLKEYEDSKGGVGDALAMAGDLLGGGGGSNAGPKASDLDAYGAKIKAAGGVLNTASVKYTDIHKTGVDLYQGYRNFAKFRDDMITKPPGSGGGAGMLGQISAISGAVGSLGKIMNVIQGIAFKMFDVYVAIFVRISSAQEQKICDACRQISINAIQTKFSPVYPVWHPKPDPEPDPNANSNSNSDPTPVKALNDAYKTVEETKDKVDKAQKDIKDFFEGASKDAPGAPFVDLAFGIAPPPDPVDGKPKPPIKPAKEVAAMVVSAFEDAIKQKGLPDFLTDVIEEIVEINDEFLRAIYKKLCEVDPASAIPEDQVFEAARKRLLQKIVDLLISKVSFLQKAKDFSYGVQGVNLSPGRALDAGEDKLNEELGAKLDPVLKIMIGQCVDVLEGLRQQANKQKAMTMEVYFGLFPYILALNFRNTFFPVWDLLIDNTFGKLGPVADAIKFARNTMKAAQKSVDDVREAKQRAEKVYDRATRDGLQVGSGGQNLTGYRDDMNSKLDRDGDAPAKPEVIPFFPLEGRLNSASGVEIKKAEYDTVKKEEKWTHASNAPA